MNPHAFVLSLILAFTPFQTPDTHSPAQRKVLHGCQFLETPDSSDVFVDFITQNRVYDYTVSGTQATENLTGFETKKTVAIRYKNRDV